MDQFISIQATDNAHTTFQGGGHLAMGKANGLNQVYGPNNHIK